MSSEEKRKILSDALNKWGITNQTLMVMEECGELLNVLAKANRNRASRCEIITELADVSIMIEQMSIFYGERDYLIEKERKLKRLKERLKNPVKN